jgi:hypothetical protein
MELHGNLLASSFCRGIGIPAARRIPFKVTFIKIRSGEDRRVHFFVGVGMVRKEPTLLELVGLRMGLLTCWTPARRG